MDIVHLLNKTFNFKVGQVNIAPTYWQAAAIVFLLFLLVLTLARMRYLFVHWSLGKSAIAMLFWGFLLALIVEGFMLIGGKTLLTELIGWKNPPKPISTALDSGRTKLINVLGEDDEVEFSTLPASTYSSVVENFQLLSSSEKEKARSFICEP